MDLHPTLKRQLKRVGADDSHPPSDTEWQELLTRVNNAYLGADQERYVLERTLEISSNEMQKLYENLKRSSDSALNQEKEKLNIILNSLADGVLEINLEGALIYLNPSAREMLATSEDALLEQPLMRFFRLHDNHQHGISSTAKLLELLAKTPHLRDDNACIIHSNLNELAVSFSLSPIIQEQQITGYVATFRDVELQKQAEAELRHAKELAEDAASTKANFLATMSHEIRTPLNGVIGIATLLADSTLDPTQRHYVSTLKSSAEVLLSLINDILDFSKMDAGKVQLESIPFALSALTHDLGSMFHNQSEQKGIKVAFKIDPQLPIWLMGDQHRLQQVLINLIGNAIKFTERGMVLVRIYSLIEEGQPHLIRFSVRDTGIGISEEALSRLFEAFTQADNSTTRKYGGSGLGLTIAKKIVELMNGNLKAESVVGKGSHFYFDLQLAPAECPITQEPSAAPLPPSITGSKRLLLVEDNKINQMVAGKFLEKFGYAYDVAENGAQALERMTTSAYDAILMDCQMPVMDGFEATKRIRLLEQVQNTHVPIIGLTANALEGDREKCLACGMDDFTTKPIKVDELQNKLAQWTNH